MKAKPLEFEKPIYELYEKLDKLENLSGKHPININTEVDNIKKRIEALKKKTYENITFINNHNSFKNDIKLIP